MKTIQKPYKTIYKTVLFLFAFPFLIAGFIFLWKYNNYAFLFNAAVWLCIGLVCFVLDKRNERKLLYFKEYGRRYEASIIRIIPKHMIKIGSYLTVKFEIKYNAGEGDRTVISDYYMLTPLDKLSNLKAEIYLYDKQHSLEISRINDIFSS